MKAQHPDHLTFWIMGPSSSRQRAARDVEQRMRRSSKGSVFVGTIAQSAPAPLSFGATAVALQGKRRPGDRTGFRFRRWETILRQRYQDITILMCFTNYKRDNDPSRAMSTVEVWSCAKQPKIESIRPSRPGVVMFNNDLCGHMIFTFDGLPAPENHLKSATGLAITGLSMMSREALSEVSCFLRSQLWEGQLEASLPSRSARVTQLAQGRL